MATKQLLSTRRPGSLSAENRAKRSDIDESLFGKGKGPRNPRETDQLIRQMREGKPKHPEIALLQPLDIDRMKRKSQMHRPGPQEVKQGQLPSDTKSQTLRDRILSIDREKKAKQPASDLDREAARQREETNERAVQLNNEQLVLVREMNKMLEYAKVATVRDRQLAGKGTYRESFKAEEKRKDLIMEVERLKAIKAEEEKEIKRKEELMRGKEVLIDQIKERDMERMKRQEEEQREAQYILKAIRAGELQDKKKAEAKLEQQKVINAEIIQANNRAALVKLQRAEEERLEYQRIAEYNREKERVEAEKQEELRRRREEEEKALQKLREKQEKQSDRQAQLDAIRAKRAFEEKEREFRRKEKEELEKRLEKEERLRVGREQQKVQKVQRAEMQAAAVREEYEHKLREIQESIEADRAKEEARRRLVEANQVQVKKQIEVKRHERKQQEGVELFQGKGTISQLEEQRRLLERIKREKLQEMEILGIPQKYRVDLERLKVK